MSDTDKKLDEMSRKEYDVDSGTYMEDVHSNDHIIGRDGNSDGLIDDVEKLLKEAEVRAEEYNVEREREQQDKNREREEEKDDIEVGL